MTTDAREMLAGILNRVAYRKDRVRNARRGKKIAAVVPTEDLELIGRLEYEIDVLEAGRAFNEAREKGVLSLSKGSVSSSVSDS